MWVHAITSRWCYRRPEVSHKQLIAISHGRYEGHCVPKSNIAHNHGSAIKALPAATGLREVYSFVQALIVSKC